MKKLLLAVLIGVGIMTLNSGDSVESQIQYCQYPARALNPDGTCDNSDPCDPTRIKIDGGKCVKEVPIKVPEVRNDLK